jgi:ribosome-associated protein
MVSDLMDGSNEGVIAINDSLWIPRGELSFRATRSGGPGGQHVNTSSTRIELVWNVDASPSLSEEQRALIRAKLANRISQEGLLSIASSEHRSQLQNKEATVARFVELLARALVVPRSRKKTRPSRASREERLRAKSHRSSVKRMRRKPTDD